MNNDIKAQPTFCSNTLICNFVFFYRQMRNFFLTQPLCSYNLSKVLQFFLYTEMWGTSVCKYYSFQISKDLVWTVVWLRIFELPSCITGMLFSELLLFIWHEQLSLRYWNYPLTLQLWRKMSNHDINRWFNLLFVVQMKFCPPWQAVVMKQFLTQLLPSPDICTSSLR